MQRLKVTGLLVLFCGACTMVLGDGFQVVVDDDEGDATGAGGGSVGGAGEGSGGTPSGNGGAGGMSGAMGGICDTGATTSDESYDACLSANCCEPFLQCASDAVCADCIGGQGSSCPNDPLFLSYQSCEQEWCPVNFCSSPLSFQTEDGIQFSCHNCINMHCCDPFYLCADPSGNGFDDEAEVIACVDCLNDPSGQNCADAPQDVQAAAQEFAICYSESCGEPCSF